MSAPDAPPPPLPPPGQPPFWPDHAAVQWIKDTEHLRLLSIFHYVLGGLAILFSSLFIFHIVFGILLLHNSGPFASSFGPPDAVSSPDSTASPDQTNSVSPTPTSTGRPTPRHTAHRRESPAFLGYMIVGIGSFAVLMGWTVGAMLIYSGRCLARRTGRVFSMVIAGISCLQVPFGTILGVFTLVALQRPSVKALYADGSGAMLPRA